MAESVRTFWKGHLRLALVTIPVRLVTAEKAEATPKFHQIDRKTKQRIRYMKVVPGKGEVKKEDIVMGYEVEDGNYVLMEDNELDAVKLETRHTIELTQFVEACEIDPLYFERPYFILPDGEVAEEGYRVIRDALRAKRKVGIGQLTLRGRENLVALYPAGNGLILDVLRYETEIKDADDIFSHIGNGKSRADMTEMAEQLIAGRTAAFEPEKYKNHYAQALRELVQSKLTKGETIAVDESNAKSGGKVLDFMEALKRSLAGGKDGKAGDGAKKRSDAEDNAEDDDRRPAKKSRAKTPARKSKTAAKARADARKTSGRRA